MFFLCDFFGLGCHCPEPFNLLKQVFVQPNPDDLVFSLTSLN